MRLAFVVLLVFMTGFDHAKHASHEQLACAQCHTVTKTGVLSGKPNHATCFGKCHGAVPTLPPRGMKRGSNTLEITPARMPVCLTCHAQPSLETGTDRKAFTAKPLPGQDDFVLAVGHKRHAAFACASCHSKAQQHERCASCHDGTKGKGPGMSLCSTCHLVADKTLPPPDARVLVRSAFSHPKHAARGTKCATCHTMTETDARELPHPTAATCAIAGCHDAKASFGVTASCTKCHQDVPVGKYDVARPDKPFSHLLHTPYIMFLPCTDCHRVEKSGEVALADHAQCAGCHADDFGSRKPEKCGACHDATEPWRKLLPDRPSLASSEFGASLNHGKHGGDCVTCHRLTTPTQQLRPPRGHGACVGKACHNGSATPAIADCDGCHAIGLDADRETQRAQSQWSVRKRFVHATHERGTTCTSCHLDMSGPDLMSIATPPKPTCAPCHDGTTAFKLTGTGCGRCHPLQPKPVKP